MATSDRVEVGSFTYENGSVSGPAEYMREQGFDRIKKIEAGEDVVFNMGCGVSPSPLIAVDGPLSPSPVVAMLVSLQTDYAAWRGSRDLVGKSS